MVYQWAVGSRVRGVNPQVAGNHLERLRKKNDQILTPAMVVLDATEPTSPLHPAFEWNDKKAALHYRESQAQYILRSIVMVISKKGEDDRVIRAFVNVYDDDQDATIYTSVIRAMNDAEMRALVVAKAKSEFEALRRKYEELYEFSKVYEALDLVEVVAVEATRVAES